MIHVPVTQHSAENLAGTEGKFEGMFVDKGNVNVNEGKEVGLVVGDNNNCMQVDGSSAHCGCVAYGSVAMAAC